jgi:hypothetical protein
MPGIDNEIPNQVDDSDNITEHFDNKVTSIVVAVFTICYILFIMIGFPISIFNEDLLIAFPPGSLFFAILYFIFCVKNICKCKHRIRHSVRFEYILCSFGIVQVLVLFLSFPLFLYNLYLHDHSSLVFGAESMWKCDAFLPSLIYAAEFPLNIITSIVHIALSSAVIIHLGTAECCIPDESKRHIKYFRTFSQISILLITIASFVYMGYRFLP